jgi:hypothetical protein
MQLPYFVLAVFAFLGAVSFAMPVVADTEMLLEALETRKEEGCVSISSIDICCICGF